MTSEEPKPTTEVVRDIRDQLTVAAGVAHLEAHERDVAAAERRRTAKRIIESLEGSLGRDCLALQQLRGAFGV